MLKSIYFNFSSLIRKNKNNDPSAFPKIFSYQYRIPLNLSSQFMMQGFQGPQALGSLHHKLR